MMGHSVGCTAHLSACIITALPSAMKHSKSFVQSQNIEIGIFQVKIFFCF